MYDKHFKHSNSPNRVIGVRVYIGNKDLKIMQL